MKSPRLAHNIAAGFVAVSIFALCITGSALAITTDQIVRQDDETRTESTESESESNRVQELVTEFKTQARNEVNEDRKTRAPLADDARKHLCDNRKGAIENKISAYTKAANQNLSRLNDAYKTLSSYVDTNSPVGVDLAAATAAKMNAEAAVKALDETSGSGTLDCDNLTDNAAWLTEIKTAASMARSELKAYKSQLQKVLVAIDPTKAVVEPKQQTVTESDSSTN